MDYGYIPSYAHDSGNATTGETQPFSPVTIEDGHTPFTPGSNLSDPLAQTRSEGYETGESIEPNETRATSQEQEHELHGDMASQDTELLTGNEWHSDGSQERSPHTNSKKWQSYSHTDDSGYIPTKSQESYGHSQPKSQEAYMTDLSLQHSSLEGPPEFALPPGNRESMSESYQHPEGQPGSLGKTSERGLKKDDELSSLRGSTRGSHKSHESSTKGHPDGRYWGGGRELHDGFPPRTRPGEFGGYPNYPRYPDGGYYRGGRDGGYPGSEADYRYHRGGGMEDGYEHAGMRTGIPDWRRPYGAGDYYHHDVPPYGRYGDHMSGSLPPYYRGQYDRPGDSLRGRHPQYRRMMSDDSRMSRTRSHERMDQLHQHASPFMSGNRHNMDPDFRSEQGPPVEYFLSQPNPSYFAGPGVGGGGGVVGGDRPPMTMGRHHLMAYDGRQAMAGPLGYSLSQPGHMMSHDRMFGDVDRPKWTPYGVRMRPLKDDGSVSDFRGRTYSIEEELSR